MSSGDCISIVIPTLNAGPLFERTLQAIRAQKTSRRVEILAVDSGSTDGTIDRLRQANANVVSIDPRDFNHGETRNAGLDRATGSLAVLLVQDAVPASDDWLEALTVPLSDEGVAGSFGRQQPWPEASRLTAHYLGRWVAAQPQQQALSAGMFGTGFALRLAAAEAQAAGGSLERRGDKLRLSLPGLTRPGAGHSQAGGTVPNRPGGG